MRRSLVLLAFVACDSFSDSDAVPNANDGGPDGTAVSDAGDDRGASSDAASDAGSDVDAGPGIPAGMVVVSTGAKQYLIDAHEVTVAEFASFKDKVSQLHDGDAGLPAVCGGKLGLGPTTASNCAVTKSGPLPVNCVDWCDAFVYCRDQGKRLCGAIAGGTVPAGKQVDPFLSQWVRACAGGANASVYPYGPTGDNTKCNNDGNVVFDAGGKPKCEGSVAGLFDMSGNVSEIDDSCVGDAGLTDQCFWHGGSAGDSTGGGQCDSVITKQRGEFSFLTGFRCCKDL